MGEAKRRKQTDPDYGKKRQAPPQPKQPFFKLPKFDLKKMSRTELIFWVAAMGVALATFVWTGTLQ